MTKQTTKKPENTFTAKQQKFIDCYAGDIKKAAEIAGVVYGTGRNWMTKNDVVLAIFNRQETETRPKDIANRQERQSFWTTVMRSGTEDMSDRLKASQHLGKSEADFVDDAKHSLPIGCGVLFVLPVAPPEEWKRKSIECHVHDVGTTEDTMEASRG